MSTMKTPPQPVSSESQSLAELIASQLSSTHLIDGHFFRMKATVDEGYIALDVTGIDFHSDTETTVRVLLHLSEPITVTPATESGFELRSSA
ncbi:MAG TPA: hypothetical protein VJT72_01005 [Pseudonocardiaceae bacterium]|nr:hypothetical protein [Pseudonocardiaceae bacterium]